MPWEHIPAVTQEGTLKSEVRTSPVMYQSNPKSALFFLSDSPSLCHSKGFLEIRAMIQLFLRTKR